MRCALDADGKRHTLIRSHPRMIFGPILYPQPGAYLPVEPVEDGTVRAITRITIDVCDSIDCFRYSVRFVVVESQLSRLSDGITSNSR